MTLAVRVIVESSGQVRIDEVARQCGIGRRQLERLMLCWVGLSPKRLARIARFQAVLGDVADRSQLKWTGVAHQSYADQSHLIHEFAEFGGNSPRRFLARGDVRRTGSFCVCADRTRGAAIIPV